MRLRNLIRGDIGFQITYGFYFVYAVFTVFYLCLIFALPESIRQIIAAIMIYTDPAAMGLFFMGAIVLLEKSQNVLNSIAVTPVKVSEYIISKAVSLGIIGTLVGSLIRIAVGFGENHRDFYADAFRIAYTMTGIFLGSVMFSLLGLIVAVKTNSLNQFMVGTIPIELICSVPPFIYLFGYRKPWMLLHPGCVIIRMVEGKSGVEPILLLLLLPWVAGIYLLTNNAVKKMFQSVGGFKL